MQIKFKTLQTERHKKLFWHIHVFIVYASKEPRQSDINGKGSTTTLCTIYKLPFCTLFIIVVVKRIRCKDFCIHVCLKLKKDD